MITYEELREKINLAFCKNNDCFPLCTFPGRDCPQAKVATREILSIIADYCWLKGELNAPKVGDLGTEYRQAQDDLYNAGWRPVKGIKPPVLSEQKAKEKCLGRILRC